MSLETSPAPDTFDAYTVSVLLGSTAAEKAMELNKYVCKEDSAGGVSTTETFLQGRKGEMHLQFFYSFIPCSIQILAHIYMHLLL